MYRSQGPTGNAVINQGTSRTTEGVKVYEFRNGSYQYWVWDGTLDSPTAGVLEVYKNNRIEMRRQCQKNLRELQNLGKVEPKKSL